MCGWSNIGFPGVGLQVEPCMDGKRWKRVKRERWKGNSEDRELGQSEGGRESGERENKEGMRKGEDSEAEMSTLGAKSKREC